MRSTGGGDLVRQGTQRTKVNDFLAWLWEEETVRRRVSLTLALALNVAVSAAISPDAYNAAVWLSTIIGRIFTAIFLLVMCIVRTKDASVWWDPVISLAVCTSVASVQMLPLYGLKHPGYCNLPGCPELNLGIVSWLSFGVTLVGPYVVLSSAQDYRFVLASSVVMIATFGGLTLHWLDSAGEQAAVTLFLIGNAILATIGAHSDMKHRQAAFKVSHPAGNKVTDSTAIRLVSSPSGSISPSPMNTSLLSNLANSSNTFLSIDVHGTIQFVSNNCGKMLGYDASELMGQQNESFIDRADHDAVRGVFEAAFKSHSGLISVRYKRIDKRGGTVPVLFVGSVSACPDRPACVLGWEADETTAPQSGMVMSRVASTTNMSRATNDSMLTFVSSGLKNSLHRLSLIAGSVFESDEPLPVETREDVGLVVASTHTANFHVNDLMMLIKLRDGNVTSAAEPTMLYSCIADVVSTFDVMAVSAVGPGGTVPKCKLYFVPPLPECVCFDSPNVQYVLTKLLLASASQVASLADAANVAVVVSFDGTNKIVIEVYDNGPSIGGITIENLLTHNPAVAKNPRAQAASSLMPMVRQLVDIMLGSLGVEQLPNGYVKFWIKVPFTRPSTTEASVAQQKNLKPRGTNIFFSGPPDEMVSRSAASAPHSEVSTFQPPKQTPQKDPASVTKKPAAKTPVQPRTIDGQVLQMHVLLVDDMKPIRRLGESFLEKLGCTCVTLEDGAEIDAALESATRPFDAILMDILMPRSDGAQVCKHLRQDMKTHCPIIAMTSKISTVDTQLYFKMGFDLVLPKPFTLEALGRALIEGRDRRFGETGMVRLPARFRDDFDESSPVRDTLDSMDDGHRK